MSRQVRTKRRSLADRVATAGDAALARNQYVAPVDVLVGIGWLAPTVVDAWRKGRIPDLESQAQVPPDRLVEALAQLHHWAQGRGLRRSEASYLAGTRDRRPLRFTVNSEPAVEHAYRTHWISPELSEAARQRLEERQNRAPDLVVIQPLSEFTCQACGSSDGGMLVMDGDNPLCLDCADLAHLVFLPAGDAALTRRAKRASGLWAVVVRFSRARKRYERQGLLVAEAALEQAEQQCLGDEEVRARRRERDRERREREDVGFQATLAAAIVRLFPACPTERAEAVARHTGARGSGRVGRSAAGRSLADDAVTLAVVASVRHTETRYDQLLMSGVPREEARDLVRADIDRVLESWRRSR